MARSDFTLALEQELQLHGVAFSGADLQEFVADAWPLMRENLDSAFWARELGARIP